MLATCYEQLGQFDDAIEEYWSIAGTAYGLSGLGYAYGRSGRRREARQVLGQLVEGWRKGQYSAYHIARVFVGVGDASEAFAWLRKAHDGRDERMVMVNVDPKLNSLRSDARFGDLLEDLGFERNPWWTSNAGRDQGQPAPTQLEHAKLRCNELPRFTRLREHRSVRGNVDCQ